MKKTNPTAPQPKFKIGDRVRARSRHDGEVEGEITEVDRTFMTIDPQSGRFKTGQMASATFERDIESIVLPFEFDGETLTIHYPEMKFTGGSMDPHTEVSKFHHYSYVVKTPKWNIVFPEPSLAFVLNHEKPAGPASGVTKRVWTIADSLIVKGVRMRSMAGGRMAPKDVPPARPDVIQACVAAGINPSTASTQYGKWRKARGY